VIHWADLFASQTPPLEIVLRGTVMYLTLFTLLRVVLKRESGTTGMTDLLVVVLLADAAQNGMAGNYQTVPDGVLLVATIVAWAWILDWMSFHVPLVERLLKPRQLLLVRDGQVLWANMRRELVTIAELESQLRLQGIDSFDRVHRAYMESDGRISVIADDHARHDPAPEPRGV
jgi:uncharacterized membrane protein YcaP (DUF421 family)